MMQISRHWRMNANRYRLEGIRYKNGAVSVYGRPVPLYKGHSTSSVEEENEQHLHEVVQESAA